MAKEGISAVLKRNLKEGKEYNKLIPRVECERTSLGRGDTFHTTEQMKEWIETYSFQTVKLSPKLKGRRLQETVNNIYQFLYDHIQYTADGALQQLRSPACTWMQRKQGVDCKSYSVFASSILSNLGIKHFIRQIRQPYFYPEEFTHVYVVVPVGTVGTSCDLSVQKELVLDATKHQNVESNYIEKVDMPMLEHIGLKAPATAPVATAPTDGRTAQLIANFNRFCEFLLQKGVPLETVNALRERISHFTSKGKDPQVNIVHDGLEIEGIVYHLEFKEKVPYLAVKNALQGGLKGNGLNSFATMFANTGAPSISGLNAGIVDAGVTLASGALPFGGLIKGVLDQLNIVGNIKNLLKYGPSSWGASSTPEEMKKRFGERAYPWLQEQLASITMDNIDRKLDLIDFTLRVNQLYFKLLRDNHSRAKSTRLVNDWATKECEKLITKTFSGISEQLEKANVSVTKRKSRSKSDLPAQTSYYFWKDAQLQYGDGWDYRDLYMYDVDQATLKNWNQLQMNPPNNTGNPSTVDGGSNYVPDNQNTGNQNTGNANPEKENGSNTGLIVAGVTAAALPLFFMMKKDATSPPAPKGGAKRTAARKRTTRKKTTAKKK